MRLKGEQEGEMIDAALKGVCERQCVCVCMCVCVCVCLAHVPRHGK